MVILMIDAAADILTTSGGDEGNYIYPDPAD